MKILITGTQGFIGSNLQKKLQTNHEVYELNEDLFISPVWFNMLPLFLFGLQPDAIFHVGACSNTLEQDVEYMMTRNFESTKILMDYCKTRNIPFIYSSSAASYGVNNFHPSNLYGWSKYVAEQYVISNGGVGLRYFNVYGPGEENKGTMASVAYQMYEKNKNNEEIKLFPKKPSRDFVYINDVVDANIFALENYDNVKGRYYDVGSGESRTFEDILKIMGIGYSYHEEDKIPNGYQFYTCSDKLKWLTGWEAKYNIEKGLTEYKNYLELSM